MIIIALTGSLATGKSTVSALLSQHPHNLPLIDADLLARQVVEPGTPGYTRIVAHFAPTTPDLLLPPSLAAAEEEKEEENTTNEEHSVGRPLNRAALGRRVFGSEPDKIRDRAVLNGIVHPLVRLAILRALWTHFIKGAWAVVVDVPLLFESRLDVFASVVVMVAVRDPAVQMARLRQRDVGLSEAEARDRVGSQMGVGEKVGRTAERDGRRGKCVWNDGDQGQLRGEVDRVMREIRAEDRGLVWRWWLLGSPLGLVLVCIWEVVCGWRARRGWESKRRIEDGRGKRKTS